MKPEPHVANPLQVSDRDPSFLSGRLRPGIEAAPWVIPAIERLEAELAEARNQLTVIDPRDWEPCTPEYLAAGGSCSAPRVWHAPSRNHWHPRRPGTSTNQGERNGN